MLRVCMLRMHIICSYYDHYVYANCYMLSVWRGYLLCMLHAIASRACYIVADVCGGRQGRVREEMVGDTSQES